MIDKIKKISLKKDIKKQVWKYRKYIAIFVVGIFLVYMLLNLWEDSHEIEWIIEWGTSNLDFLNSY